MPEAAFSFEKLVSDVKEVLGRLGRVFIVAGEGLKDDKGQYVTADSGAFAKDSFGHVQLGGVAEMLKAVIEKEVGIKARFNKLGTNQRSAMHFASATDVAEAYMVGSAAVAAAVAGTSGKMITLVRGDDGPYRCATGTEDLAKVANAEKPVPRQFINAAGNGLTQAFLDYARPLIAGQAELEMGADGLPVYARLARHFVARKSGREYKV
jgi:6-phosphofructokinase 1